MHIDFRKSGMNIWSLVGLFILLVGYMFFYSIKSYNAPYNAPLRLGEYIAYDSGDTEGYIGPIENFIQKGEYSGCSIETKTVGRGPYCGIYYYIFRQFLPVAKAYDAVAVLQILWYALAIIILMLLVEPYIKYKSLVWLIPIIVVAIKPCFTYLPRILTDPIANSQLICFAYFYIQFNKTGDLWKLGFASLFLAMASVMKPYLLPIYAICFFDWIISTKILDVKRWAKYVGIMSVPLVVICLPFTIHNAVKLHIFAPVQNTTFGGFIQDPAHAAMRNMVRTWGEDHTEWGGLGTYFMPCEGISYNRDIPSHIYTEEYGEDDIRRLAEQCRSYDKMAKSVEKDSIRNELVQTMNHYRDVYIKQHPYWRIRATLKQYSLLMKPTPFIMNHRHSGIRHYISNAINLISVVMEWLLLVGGLIGLICILKSHKDLRFMSLIVIFIILYFSVTLYGENRYYIICVLFEMVGLIILLDKIMESLQRERILKYE